MTTQVDPFIAKISDLVEIDPVMAEDSTSYGDILALLRKRQAGSVVLRAGDRVTGVFTSRDILKRCLLESVAPETPISDLMTKEPFTIAPDATIREAIAFMHARRVRNAPVVDAEGRLAGFLTIGRIIRFLANSFPSAVLNLPPEPSQVSDEREGG